MNPSILRVLVVDDNEQLALDAQREIHDAFDGEPLTVVVNIENDFDRGYERVRAGECDVVVLDVRRDRNGNVPDDDQAGARVFSDIRGSKFLPVIFWTALPDQVRDSEMPPFVVVLGKDQLPSIPSAIRAAVEGETAHQMGALEARISNVMREHMWSEIAPNWAEYLEGGRLEDMSRVLITRVAQWLEDQDDTGIESVPSRRYVYPPVATNLRPGDVMVLDPTADAGESWWSVLTPACDFAQSKVEFALLVGGTHLTNFTTYKEWVDSQDSKTKWGGLQQLLTSRLPRYHYLPRFRAVPDLVLDFENLVAVPVADLSNYRRVASLASPYSEHLLIRNSDYRSRIGVPDQDLKKTKARLQADARL
ncbi:hypothetical protein [Agromyces sp. NPDC058064]|uniref:hypothetical protein n=1 Tax=Agromyces sp. NPDC058064 TaxID=3346322 RepID=UPI0036DB9E9C